MQVAPPAQIQRAVRTRREMPALWGETAGRLDQDTDSPEPTLVDLPGIGRIAAECQAGPQSVFRLFNTSGETVDQSALHKGVPSATTIPNGGASAFPATVADVWQLQVATRGAAPTVATIVVSQSFEGPKACEIFAQATVGS